MFTSASKNRPATTAAASAGSGGMPAMQLVFVRSCVLVLCSAPVLRMPAARQLIAEQ